MPRAAAPTATTTSPGAAPKGFRQFGTGFFGRDAALVVLANLFARGARLVTVAGPGGIGKTRLATEFAAGWRGAPAWFCDLTAAHGAPDVLVGLGRLLEVPAAALGRGDDAALDALGRAVAAHGPALVVLDNFEHLPEPAATSALAALVARAPAARWLVTSRRLLRVSHEHAFELPPLAVPASDAEAVAPSPAVELLLDRVRRARPGYAPDAAERAALARLTRRLDGIPLALELAAARMRVLGPAALLARLERGLDVLAAHDRDRDARHVTMRAAIAGSWDQLAPREQGALACCAVFHGTFTADAAEAVVGPPAHDALDAVQALRDHSLLTAHELPDGSGELRLGMYATVREFALEQLRRDPAAAAAATERHARYCTESVARWAGAAFREGHGAAVRRLALERCDLLAAVDHLLARPDLGGDDAARALWALAAAAHLSQHSDEPTRDYLPRLDAAEARGREAGAPLAARAWARAVAGALRYNAGEVAEGWRAIDEALLLAEQGGDDRATIRVLVKAAAADLNAGTLAQARGRAERAIALSRATGDREHEGVALSMLAFALQGLGDPRSREHFDAALSIHREVGNRVYEVRTAAAWAWNLPNTAPSDEARAHFERVVALAREVGERRVEAIALGFLGLVRHDAGELEAAIESQRSAAAALRKLDDWFLEAQSRVWLGFAHAERGEVAAALEQLDEALEAFGRHQSVAVAGRSYDFEDAHVTAQAVRIQLAAAAAAAAASPDDLLAAERALRELEAAAGGGTPRAAMIAAQRARVELARARRLEAAGAREQARTLAAAADACVLRLLRRAPEQPDQPCAAERSISVRIALRAAGFPRDYAPSSSSSAPPPRPADAAAITIHRDGDWFCRPPAPPVGCHTRRALRRLLAALGAQWAAARGVALSTEQMFEAGWPGERISPESARKRVQVAVLMLRDLGLRDVLLSHAGGYLLDPDAPIELVTTPLRVTPRNTTP